MSNLQRGPGIRGAYVTLDGPDGVGKSNQAARLADVTGSQLTREPGGAISQIRTLLLDPSIELTPEAEVLLFSADRNISHQRIITPNLKAGRSVVSDRSCLSTLAYQCYGRALDLAYARAATDLAIGNVCADIAVILDAPYEVTQARVRDRNRGRDTAPQDDRFEAEDKKFKNRVRNGFLELARDLGGRAVLIDASGTKQETFDQIMQACGKLLVDGVEA